MVCILLPDFPSSLVASVLSILYYGEVWLNQLSYQVDTVNSLFNALGLDLSIVGSQDQDLKLVRKSEIFVEAAAKHHIKKEPVHTLQSTNSPGNAYTPSCQLLRIKKEEPSEKSLVMRSFIPTVQTATVQPLATSSSLYKCPNVDCEFHAETIPDMQSHIYECKQSSRHTGEMTYTTHTVPQKVLIVGEDRIVFFPPLCF